MKVNKSVALKYEPEVDNAPKVVAKGKGVISDIINRIAKDNNVPLYEDELLVDLLYKIDIDYEIPGFLYEVMAELLSFTYNINKKRGLKYNE